MRDMTMGKSPLVPWTPLVEYTTHVASSIDSIFIPWYQGLREALLAEYPLPDLIRPIPDEVQLPPKMVLQLAPDSSDDTQKKTPQVFHEVPSEADFAPDDMLPIPKAFTAQVAHNTRVTPTDHWQDVRHITFQLSQDDNETTIPKLVPGSTLIVYPKNYPSDVQRLIDIMDWNEVADRPLQRVPYPKRLSTPSSLPESLRHRFSGASNLHTWEGATLRDLLTHNFDITSVPKRSFIGELIGFTPAEREKERLQELTALGNVQDFYDYTSRPRRTIIELLQDFPEVKIPFERALGLFPLIRGREFSIANGGASILRKQQPSGVVATIEILAAIVEYQTIIRKPRQGICSRYLKHLRSGAIVRVGIKTVPSGPPCDAAAVSRPLIAIATGTGIAPIRSLIQLRRHVSSISSSEEEAAASGPALLFFGCRNENADFYFRDEWESTPNLTVVPAFSRDPLPAQDGDPDAGAKNYVQFQIRRHAAEVADLISRGAAVCLCGNSGRMPVQVKEALLESLVLGGLVGDAAEAEEYWLKVDFWQETW